MFQHMLIICQVCYDVFAQHLEDFTFFFFFFTVLQMKRRLDGTEATQAQMWITQTHTCQSSEYQTPYSFYLPLIYDRTSQQPLEDTSKEYGAFSTIPSSPFVLQELLAQDKVRSCWSVGGFFMCDFSDGRCAVQWIYKGTSAFKNIRKETFPTQTDRQEPKVRDAQTASGGSAEAERRLICCFMFALESVIFLFGKLF